MEIPSPIPAMGKCMIKYSTYMLPNPIHPEKGSLAYAKAQVNEVLSFRKFVQHIADHGGYTRGKVKGVLSDMSPAMELRAARSLPPTTSRQ